MKLYFVKFRIAFFAYKSFNVLGKHFKGVFITQLWR